MRRVRVARNVRDRHIRIAWWKGLPCSYPSCENISGVLQEEISPCHVKKLRNR
jgi:hypothetical protein